MAYQLLTGATGLLGSYLLKDLETAGRPVAVAVRASRTESARQRVETILAGWEHRLRRVLPRPVVLECDIGEPLLGLDDVGIDWVTRNCDGILHNAASVSFDANEKTGEPYRSNVEGTRNVLELARSCRIREFHHVSTAYVCGLRSGRVLEDELDVGQQSGNAYEKSKIEAEKLVRAASFLDKPTVYRPSIIIGDSETGYTTTFHGFYAPLKIVQAVANQIDFDFQKIDGAPLVAALNLTGQEGKNYVPVDWVSRMIVLLAGRPELRGRTFHLTTRFPTSIALTCEVTEEALREYAQSGAPTKSARPQTGSLEETFVDQMETYRAYWRDDPEFDCRNTREAAPEWPCPQVDRDMLLRTARFAYRTNFGWPRPQPLRASFDVLEHLSGVVPVQLQNGHDCRQVRLIGVQVNGPGGGQWTLAVQSGRPIAAQHGLAEERHAVIYLNSRTYERCVRGELTVDEAHHRGQLALETDQVPRDEVLGIFGSVIEPHNQQSA
jgi:thioester reductase-like protein